MPGEDKLNTPDNASHCNTFRVKHCSYTVPEHASVAPPMWTHVLRDVTNLLAVVVQLVVAVITIIHR